MEQPQNPTDKSQKEAISINNHNTHTHDYSHSWLLTCTSIESGGVKLVLCAQTSSFSEMMGACTCFPHVSKMPTLKYNRGSNVVIKNAIILNIIIL